MTHGDFRVRNTRFERFKVAALIATALALVTFCASADHAENSWRTVLSKMRLREAPLELNRTNAVQTVLSAFQANDLVKAIVFMPGATDEFYLFRRARAQLTNGNPSLLDAITALTNQTFIHATFRAPFLLLHTDEDPLTLNNTLADQETGERLQRHVVIGHLSCNDWDWDRLQPLLKHSLKIALRPWHNSTDSWHFYRHSFAAWNIDGLQALELAALAGKSRFVLRRKEARFEVDSRALAAPKFNEHLR